MRPAGSQGHGPGREAETFSSGPVRPSWPAWLPTRRRPAGRGRTTLGHTPVALRGAPIRQFRQHPDGSPGVDERGGPHLDGARPRALRELGRYVPAADASHPDDGRRRRESAPAVEHGPDGNRVERRPREPSATSAQPRPPRSGVEGQPPSWCSPGVNPPAPLLERGARDGDEVSDVGAQLGSRTGKPEGCQGVGQCAHGSALRRLRGVREHPAALGPRGSGS